MTLGFAVMINKRNVSAALETHRKTPKVGLPYLFKDPCYPQALLNAVLLHCSWEPAVWSKQPAQQNLPDN